MCSTDDATGRKRLGAYGIGKKSWKRIRKESKNAKPVERAGQSRELWSEKAKITKRRKQPLFNLSLKLV